MVVQPVRRSVPEQVFEQIAADVLSGEMRPGEALPSERRLATVFGASRPAVREGLKRLSAASLVEVRHGGVTTVRDFRRHAGLDLLPRLLFRDGELDPAVFRSILEARLRIGPKVAELAAEYHGPELGGLLEDSLRVLEAEENPLQWHRDTLAFWDHVVDGAGSIVFRLMYNAFRAAYEPALAALGAAVGAEAMRPDGYRKLAVAVCAGESAVARQAAHDVLELANATLMAALDSQGSRR
ncbi:GntR family transcriptional regulator [Mycobacterium sp. 852002-51163_SCH5372311]|uniref:FadR/GntR family transcriptional regulator n=1 Tax=Mycobacterium sp. 852002-51163_SCH5372311 TaxID=1834097 RepID=UPI0007FD1B9A|nr:GntR family transcriptional regulator [Mycobacterium sp. 852002-51163_SCH5372311]OBF93337.1 GntR family transcriptional regulator [Mycobacterium sp. 852002-51163_SCH5372311]